MFKADREARETFEGFSDTLKKVLPPSLDFHRIAIRMPEVVLETGTGNFALDAASGGLAASNGHCLANPYEVALEPRRSRCSLTNPKTTCTQASSGPCCQGLVKAFPQAQFIAATHNPFVVTSVQESNVVVLDFVDGRVESKQLKDEEVDRSATVNQVLTDVLGVPFPAPLWVEHELDRIVKSVQGKELNAENLSGLRSDLTRVGLGSLFPEVIERVLPADNGAGEGRVQ